MTPLLADDLTSASEGRMTPAELRRRHPAVDTDALLDLDARLVSLSHAEPAVPTWSVIAPAMADAPGSPRRVRVLIAALAAVVVMVPVTADAIEGVAPEAVRDTVIDRLTDVLPWDHDAPITDRPVDDRPPADRVPDEPSSDRAPAQWPSDEIPVEQRPSDAPPTTAGHEPEAPAGPVDDAPVDHPPTEHAPVDDDRPVDGPPPSDRPPAGDRPAPVDGARD